MSARHGKPVEQPGFVKFWEVWPPGKRKEARGKCAEVWRKAGVEQVADLVLAHVAHKKAATDWAKDGGAFVEAPLVYLNQRRWEGADLTTAKCATATSRHSGLYEINHTEGVPEDGSLA